MLHEKQAAALLADCEKIVEERLDGVRGSLRQARSRAAAVWELIVLDAASQVGHVRYEPLEGASPDIELKDGDGHSIWIEAAYLYPRFWREERRSMALVQWVFEMAEHRNIEAFKLHHQFFGDASNAAGAIRTVPQLDERNRFFRNTEINAFFNAIKGAPARPHSVSLSDYTVTFDYDPSRQGPFSGGGGLEQEAPIDVRQHAVFRRLEAKAAQHKIDGFRVVCIGSDQSTAVQGDVFGGLTTEQAVREAFARNRSLSAAIIVSIDTVFDFRRRPRNVAQATLYINPGARNPLSCVQTTLLKSLDFNRWKYGPRLDPWEEGPFDNNLPGEVTYNPGEKTMKISLPAHVFVAALQGNVDVLAEYAAEDLRPLLKQRWEVSGCTFSPAVPRGGTPATIELELQIGDAVFWPAP